VNHLQKHDGTSSNTKESHTSTVLSSSSTSVDSRLSGSSSTVLSSSNHTRGSSRNLRGNSARAVGDGDGGGRRDGVDVAVDGGGVRASGGSGADSSDAVVFALDKIHRARG
jgi:hypothetical protein